MNKMIILTLIAVNFLFSSELIPPSNQSGWEELIKGDVWVGWTNYNDSQWCKSTSIIKAPLKTISTLIEDKVPLRGEGTSILTLSVSNSTKGSSESTFSPTCLSHLDTVASVIDSPNEGTKI